eukprot:TRINITY_DN19600_c0_g1_i1.p1 TRINITY_DN19600_c0_g1~~TRINITY_DN19600_c0_g1_i1.p1  ORF type:complete len:193 (-),score=61.95 TRINITY_DN19600_c0_g1_i1:236-814(-)
MAFRVENYKLDEACVADASNDCSTAASSAGPGTPDSAFREPRTLAAAAPSLSLLAKPPGFERVALQPPPGLAAPPGLAPPPGLEGLCVDCESGSEDAALVAGATVTIDGLKKLPAFNGLSGTVQCIESNGRYKILLATPVAGHKWASVKRENIQLLLPPSPPPFDPTLTVALEEMPSKVDTGACLLRLQSLL